MSGGSENRVLLIKLVVVAGVMFGFGFALAPFYNKLCEAVGLNQIQSADAPLNTQVDRSRLITMQFDSNLNESYGPIMAGAVLSAVPLLARREVRAQRPFEAGEGDHGLVVPLRTLCSGLGCPFHPAPLRLHDK